MRNCRLLCILFVLILSCLSCADKHCEIPVDLGLSVKWAPCNLAARGPERTGEYYAWGEIKPKRNYSIQNSVTMGKHLGVENHYPTDFFDAKLEMGESFNNLPTYLSALPKDCLHLYSISGGINHDAARNNKGNHWRLPTAEECAELICDCEWIWSETNGVKGYKVVGPNGNSIFLPAAGYKHGTNKVGQGHFGLYWTATPHYQDGNEALRLAFSYLEDEDSSCVVFGKYMRSEGLCIRPVYE